jgi:dTDP-glucose 4,6-dehydratase
MAGGERSTTPWRLLVTGGAGFIGSAFVRGLLGRDPERLVIVLDKLTYAGNRRNLESVELCPGFRFVHGDIADAAAVDSVAGEVDAIVNFAAESHVDRSIESPGAFIRTEVEGTFVLMEAARRHGHQRYLQVSTDEVYGSLAIGSAREDHRLEPRSPYAASKAAGDMLVLAFGTTYGLSVGITRGSNTFGPYQYPEKILPLFVTNAIDEEPLPLYGDGLQVRDWLHVDDHCEAIELVLTRGEAGEVYNVAGKNELTNLELTRLILDELDRPWSLVRSVPDRPGHDRRYSLDVAKITRLGWQARSDFRPVLSATIRWYRDHPEWWRPLKEGEYREFYERQYADRLKQSTALA